MIKGWLILLAALLIPSAFAAQTITPAEARQHVGQSVVVRGVVANVFTSGKGNTFLNFGAPFPRQIFTGVVFEADAEAFEQIDLHALQGREIGVAGEVTLYKGKPQIILKDPSQVLIDR